jgi:hypothetical protein
LIPEKENEIGKMCSLQNTDIPKVFFMPHQIIHMDGPIMFSSLRLEREECIKSNNTSGFEGITIL